MFSGYGGGHSTGHIVGVELICATNTALVKNK